MSPPGEYHHHFSPDGFTWIEFPLNRRSMNPFTELATLLRVIRVYRDQRPDLALHFTVKCALYGSLAARFTGLRRVINSVTGLGHLFIAEDAYTGFIRSFALRVYRFALKGTKVVFQNSDDRQVFLTHGLVKEQNCYMVQGSGVDLNYFTPSGTKPERPLVLLPTRMLWVKGVREFVEASRSLKAAGVEADFVLAGDNDPGNPASISEQQLTEWHRSGSVEWRGFCQDMRALFSEAHIVCLPSYREGLSKVLIEAAAAGLPLVATDIPGNRSIVQDGVNGLLVPMKDPESLAKALQELIEDPERCQTMGQASRRIATADFSIEQILTGYGEVTASFFQNSG